MAIEYLRGKACSIAPGYVVVEVGGVGIGVYVPRPFSEGLKEGEEVVLHSHLHLKEGVVELYGFPSQEERDLFKLLISISGVGPRTGMALISGIGVRGIYEAISSGDAKAISSIPGIGRRTAERIVVELKERITRVPAAPEGKEMDLARKAIDGLLALGFGEGEVRDLVMKALRSKEIRSVEDLIAEVLRSL
jgi:Holliday junction DNA helicase RuvA